MERADRYGPQRRAVGSLVLAAGLVLGAPALAGEWDLGASVGYEARAFLLEPAYPGQFEGVQSAVLLEGDVRWFSEEGRSQFVFLPFARLDGQDEQRTDFDLREAYYRYIGDDWDVRLGLGKVFWGRTESRHLVDIINQSDTAADTDEEDKLGQPMIEIASQQDWGRVTVYVLPGFRERTFSGAGGRLRPPLPIDEGGALYESDDEENHVDFALRYAHYIGDWDFGLSVFRGTSREPTIILAPEGDRFLPVYNQISQLGGDVQYTTGAWLWKGEAIVREGHGETFAAFVGGFEYTFYGVTQNGADLGILLEYHNDGRSDDPALAPLTVFDDDVFVGARYALNDFNDTSILAGAIVDVDTGSTSAVIEAERRIGDNWFAEIEGRFTTQVDNADALAAFDADDAVTFRLTRYF